MPLEIQNYKAVGKGCLLAQCDIKMPIWGNFIIYGISIFEKDGKRWISFPSREYEKEGQKKYFQHCRFEAENMTEAFRKEFFKELDRYLKSSNPSVFDKEPEKSKITLDLQPKQQHEECPF